MEKAHFLVEFMVYMYAPERKNSALALLLERPLKMSLNFLCRWRFCMNLQTRDTQNQMCQKVVKNIFHRSILHYFLFFQIFDIKMR